MRLENKLTVFTMADGTAITTRSALEARWAIFFSELKIAWKYEPVVLDRYIPDFSVDGFGFVEIKPTLDLLRTETALKIERTAREYRAEKFYAIIGNKVGFDLNAMWQGDQLYAVPFKLMFSMIQKLTPYHIPTAMNRANTAKLDHFVSIGKVIDLNRIAHV